MACLPNKFLSVFQTYLLTSLLTGSPDRGKKEITILSSSHDEDMIQLALSTADIVQRLALEELPPTTMNTKRLFGSLAHLLQPSSHYLPNEILSQIFLFAVRDAEDRYEAILIPITLSHVSSRWRHVAISTGGLWTNIIITFPTSCGQVSRTVTWLVRSQSYPIDIFLDFRDPSWDWELAESSHMFRWQDMEAILRLLMTHVERWNHFELLTDTWAPIFTFLCYTRRVTSAPLLETISLSRCNAYFASNGVTFSPVEMKKPIPLFGGLALDNLREVILTGVHVDWAESSLRNLTTLKFRYHANDVTPSLHEFIDILAMCPDIQELSIIGRGPRLDVIPIHGNLSPDSGDIKDILTKLQRTIKLRHLTCFTFGFIDTDYALKLLPLFSFPALTELTLEGFSVDLDPLELHSPDATPILEWLVTSQKEGSPAGSAATPQPVGLPLNNIHTLQLRSIHATEDTFSSLFSKLPSLLRLILFETHDDALHALTSPSDSDTPRTPCCTLKELECYDMDPETFASVITTRTRIKSIPQLEKKFLAISNDVTIIDHDKLLQAGITISCDPIENLPEPTSNDKDEQRHSR